MRRNLFNGFVIVSSIGFVLVAMFFLGKHIGPDNDGNPNALYWLRWRADGFWWLSAGKLPIFGLDLEGLLMVVTLIPPGAWLIGLLCARRRRAKGACATCGYDLRATPGRCPECGGLARATSHPERGLGSRESIAKTQAADVATRAE
jgi:hypothetical protein